MRKKFIYNIIFSVANIIFPVISFPYASRILGPAGIGKVQMAFSFAQYFSLIAAFGIPVYGIQKIAKVKQDKEKLYTTLTELFCINFIASVLISVVYLAVIFTVPYFSSSSVSYLIAGSIVLTGCMNIDWFYAGLENFKSITIRSVGIKILSLWGLYFWVKRPSDYEYYLIITLFAYLGNYIAGFFIYVKKINLTTGIHIKQHIRPLFFVVSTMIVASIYTMLDTVMLGFFSDDTSVGLYTAAVKLTRIVIPVITAFGTAMIPRFAEHFGNKDVLKVKELIHTSFRIIILLAIPAGFGLYLLSNEFILVFSGEQFSAAANAMKVLSALPLVVGMGHLFIFQIMAPAEKNREMLWSAIIGTFVFIVLNFLLVPVFLEMGEAIVTLITELVVSLTYYYFLRKTICFDFDKKTAWQSVISSVIFIPLVLLIRSFHLTPILTLLTGVLVCIIAYGSMQLFVFKNKMLLSQYQHLKKIGK